MSCCVNKNYYSPQKKWILLLNAAEIRRKTPLRQPYCNLYHYAGNNPVKYIDPDGNSPVNPYAKYDNYGRELAKCPDINLNPQNKKTQYARAESHKNNKEGMTVILWSCDVGKAPDNNKEYKTEKVNFRTV